MQCEVCGRDDLLAYTEFSADKPVACRHGYDSAEQDEIIEAFSELLRGPTRDGGRKREAGSKPSWKVDPSHYAAADRHRERRLAGEKVDPDSGCHPAVHEAWRLLAIAWQETHDE